MTDPEPTGHGPSQVIEDAHHKGSQDRFNRLYDAYFTFVWRNLRYFGVGDEERPDLVQEVWLVVHRRLGSLRDDEEARKWIWGIVRRVVQQHRRTRRRALRKSEALSTTLGDRTEASVESRTEARGTLSSVIGALPDDQREVLMLACHGGLTGPEIADVLGLSVNTIYSKLRLARQRVDIAIAMLEMPDEAPASVRQRCLAVIVGLGAGLGAPGAAAQAKAGQALGAGAGPTSAGAGLRGWWTHGAVRLLAAAAAAAAVAGAVALGATSSRPSSPPDATVRSAMVPTFGERAREVLADRHGTSPGPRTDRASTIALSEPSGPSGPSGPSVPSLPSLRPSLLAPPATSDAEDPQTKPVAARSRRRETALERPPVPSPTPAATSASRLQSELELLSPANTALPTDPARALRLLRQHAERFPDSDLWDLRESARIKALCRLGRVEAAREHAATLEASGSLPTAVKSALATCEQTEVSSSGHGPPTDVESKQ